MSLADRTVNFGSSHSITPVGRRFDGSCDRLVKAGPSRSALELRVGLKQRTATARARERAGTVLLVQRARSGSFGAVLPQHLKLLRRQCRAPLVFCLRVGF